MSNNSKRVGLFITCLVDFMRPKIGFDCLDLIKAAGYIVEVPTQQICCGQPAFNSGDTDNARAVAVKLIDALAGYDYIVAPSGSCIGMIVKHYPEIFLPEDPYYAKSQALIAQSYELTDFLWNIAKISLPTSNLGTITYHDSCSGLRELGIKHQPRQLCSDKNITINELHESEACCGFGGTFCLKYPEISAAITHKKIDNIIANGAPIVAGGDLGCLMTMAGALSRQNAPQKCFHIAEILNDTTSKAIGEE